MSSLNAINFTLFSLASNFTCIGVRRISSYLKSKGINVRIIFVPGDSKHEISLTNGCKEQLMKMVKTDSAVGISFSSNYLKIAQTITRLIKDKLPIPVIWGGVHATVSPEESLDVCDVICLGEGEDPLFDFLNRQTTLEKKYEINNFWFKVGNQIVRNKQRPLRTNLDDFHFQDYEIENHFILTEKQIRPLKINDLKRSFGFPLTRMMTFGCPARCTYCVNDRYQYLDKYNSLIRRYSVNYFIEETKYILNKLPFIDYLLFDDDAFLSLPREVIEEFSQKYKKEINLPFGIGGIKAEMVKEEKLIPLVDAGLITVRMGIQSASQKVNKEVYRRQFSKEGSLKAANIFKLLGNKLRPPFYDVILDNPWEEMQDKLETLSFFNGLPRPYFFNAFSLTFFPGTELYERALREKLISGYDPAKHYHNFKKNLFNLFMLSLGLIRYPGWLYRRIINSKRIKDENKEYGYIYYIYILLNLFIRLVSYYTNRRFLIMRISRRSFCRRKSIDSRRAVAYG